MNDFNNKNSFDNTDKAGWGSGNAGYSNQSDFGNSNMGYSNQQNWGNSNMGYSNHTDFENSNNYNGHNGNSSAYNEHTDTSSYKNYPQPEWLKNNNNKSTQYNQSYENRNYNNTVANNTASEPLYTIKTKNLKIEIGKPPKPKVEKKKDPREYLDATDPEGAEVIKVDPKKKIAPSSKIPLVVISAVQIAVLIYSIIQYDEKGIIIFNMVITAFLNLFLYVGVKTLVDAITLPKAMKNRCTDSVTAKIVDVRTEHYRDSDGHRHTHYYPVYKYTYRGKVYIDYASSTRGLNTFTVNDVIEFFVNPADPEEYYIDSAEDDKSSVFMSLFFIIVPLIVLCAFIFGS
ncbi:MAG: DUF3592 domain-containing protein [Acutalibacteraceae bacterium]|nr:DUF3592 domain-containing protein [Acutalibacteraceae bacterium]